MPKYRHKLTVSGSGNFPLDMLRYDQCWPESQFDVEKIGYDADRIPRPVSVVAVTDNKTSPFREDRWRSFGWQPQGGEVIKL